MDKRKEIEHLLVGKNDFAKVLCVQPSEITKFLENLETFESDGVDKVCFNSNNVNFFFKRSREKNKKAWQYEVYKSLKEIEKLKCEKIKTAQEYFHELLSL